MIESARNVWLARDERVDRYVAIKIAVASETGDWRESWEAGIRLPPEVYFLLQESLSFPSDIWALACAIWELISLCPLFDTLMRDPTADDVIEQHVEAQEGQTYLNTF